MYEKYSSLIGKFVDFLIYVGEGNLGNYKIVKEDKGDFVSYSVMTKVSTLEGEKKELSILELDLCGTTVSNVKMLESKPLLDNLDSLLDEALKKHFESEIKEGEFNTLDEYAKL